MLVDFTEHAQKLKTQRLSIRLSQAALSRAAKVSRFRLWAYEQGSADLTLEEQKRIEDTLRNEANRLESISRDFNLKSADGA